MRILSIDVGIKNLGYTLLEGNNIEGANLSFGIVDVSNDSKHDLVEKRCTNAFDFIAAIEPTVLIIERQVHENTQAMCLMYSIVTIAISIGAEVVIFDPKLKFTTLKIPFSTKNKMHKKLSIEMARSLLTNIAPDLVPEFNKVKKKDDIADSLIQLYVHLVAKKEIDWKVLRSQCLG
jgi:Holliday junction resolvasome RuvABC endonuclease subunit